MPSFLGSLVLASAVQVLAVNSPGSSVVPRATDFRDDFDSFDKDVWGCEYSCPIIDGAKARFNLHSGAEPDTTNSWCKASYKAQRFTSGTFSTFLSLSARPEQAVWWGVALWDDGPSDDQWNEIDVGYTTDQSFTNSQLFFEVTKLGEGVSRKIDTGVDLYTEEYHNVTIDYDSEHVSLYFDGEHMETVSDTDIIPSAGLSFLLGPRLVSGTDPLPSGFTQSVDWVTISAP